MPEGHTLHRLARRLDRDLAGSSVRVSSPQGRFPDAAQLDGRKLLRAEAIGKHLLLHFEGGVVTHVHLGLFGRFRKRRAPAPARFTTRMRLEGPRATWDLSGPTCCEVLRAKGVRELRARIGADPLDPRADPSAAIARIRKSRRAIGALLLDQELFSGIGNVYRAELLFLAGIHPALPGHQLSESKLFEIWENAKRLLDVGAKIGRIVTVPQAPGTRVRRAEALYVYGRRTCRACRMTIRRTVVGGRAINVCEGCQPLGEPSPRADASARSRTRGDRESSGPSPRDAGGSERRRIRG